MGYPSACGDLFSGVVVRIEKGEMRKGERGTMDRVFDTGVKLSFEDQQSKGTRCPCVLERKKAGYWQKCRQIHLRAFLFCIKLSLVIRLLDNL